MKKILKDAKAFGSGVRDIGKVRTYFKQHFGTDSRGRDIVSDSPTRTRSGNPYGRPT